MFKPEQYKIISGNAGMGSYSIGVNISVAGIEPTEEEAKMIQDFGYEIYQKLYNLRIKRDPANIAAAAATVQKLKELFTNPIYVETIPNEYWGESSATPWLMVTTDKGRIKIGWRKRVISIEWPDSDIKSSAEDLFPEENVTKDHKLIHAHSYEDAKKYLTILGV